MGDFDTAGWEWDHSDYSRSAVGDSGPWVWWLPYAWQAVADPRGDHRVPPAPTVRAAIYKNKQTHSGAIAWWSPLLQLLFFGSGWVRPDLGLARWLELGQPQNDPVLRVVARWWGPHVADVLAWAGHEQVVHHLAKQISDSLHIPTTDVALPDRWADRRRLQEWEDVWGGGGDSMHLTDYTRNPIWTNHAVGVHMVTDSAQMQPRAVLMLSPYEGWYKRLHYLGSKLPARSDDDSWRVDVIVREATAVPGSRADGSRVVTGGMSLGSMRRSIRSLRRLRCLTRALAERVMRTYIPHP
jgi:hypothetical protein